MVMYVFLNSTLVLKFPFLFTEVGIYQSIDIATSVRTTAVAILKKYYLLVKI